jgi:hypothetical protein
MEWLGKLLRLLWAYIEVAIKRAERESEGSSEERTMTIDFDGIKNAALNALEDANAKEELLDVLKDHKGVFVEEGRGYLKAIVATFTGNQYNPEKYAEFISTLDDEQLVAEAAATANELDGLVARYNAKKKFLEDLKTTVSFVVRKAIIAGLTAYTGPAAGPIAGLLGL